MIRRALLVVGLLATTSFAQITGVGHDRVYNPFTGRLDFVTMAGTASWVAASTLTATHQLWLPYTTVGQCLQVGTGGLITTTTCGGGGGSSTMAVYEDTTQISSPTAITKFAGGPFNLSFLSGATAYIDINYSSITARGNTFNGANQLVLLDGSGFLPALNASALTNLDASDLATGTVADARLSSNVDLLDSTNTHTAQQSWSSASPSTFTALTVSGLTASRCVETTTGGRLTVASGVCGSGGGGDNLGSHIATMTVTANYGLITTTVTASSITVTQSGGTVLNIINNDNSDFGTHYGINSTVSGNLGSPITAYGISSSITGGPAGPSYAFYGVNTSNSGTDYGAYLSASGGGRDYGLYVDAGQVHINSSATIKGSGGLGVTYSVSAGSMTGAGLTTCGDSTHALGWSSTDNLFTCQAVSAGGGGGSPIAITTGTYSTYSNPAVSSPLVVGVFHQNQFKVRASGTTGYFELDTSSVTLQGNSVTFTSLQTQITATGVSTGSLQSQLNTVATATTTLASNFPVSLSTNTMGTLDISGQTNLSATGSANLVGDAVNVGPIKIGSGTIGPFDVSTTSASVTGAGGVSVTYGLTAGTVTVNDDAFASTWNGSTLVPTKNAVYDQSLVVGLTTASLRTTLNTVATATTTLATNFPVSLSTNTMGSIDISAQTNLSATGSANMVGDAVNVGPIKIGSGTIGPFDVSATSASATGVSGAWVTYGLTAATATVNDDTYGAGWNGSNLVPTKNAVYDKIETITGASGVVATDTVTWSGGHSFLGSTTFYGMLSIQASTITLNNTVIFSSYVIMDANSNLDAGSAAGLEIPNGTNPTVDTTGDVAWDTTSGQLLVYNGQSVAVVAKSTQCFNVNVSSGLGYNGLNEPIWSAPMQAGVTITSITARSLPTGTTVLFQLDETMQSFDTAGTDVFSVAFSSAIYQGNTTVGFANSSIAAGASLILNCPAAGAAAGSPRTLYLNICYIETRQ